MDQRLSLITLGYPDPAAARGFFEALGWSGVSPGPDVTFFQLPGFILGVWSREELAKDSCRTDTGGWGGITLAFNVGSPGEVDAVLDEAVKAGAGLGRGGAETFWGGYSGVFIDPGGHPWEVAHNPAWNVGTDGATTMPTG